MLKPIRKNVLLEKKYKKMSDSKIILLSDENSPKDSLYEVTLTVLGIGGEVKNPEIKIGDVVYLEKYAMDNGALRVKIISGKQGDPEVIHHEIHSYESLIGIEDGK